MAGIVNPCGYIILSEGNQWGFESPLRHHRNATDQALSWGQLDERECTKVRTDRKPRANNWPFRGKIGVLLERC
jgi:hypothetical protein